MSNWSDVNFTNHTIHVHVTYAFQSESTLYSCLNVKELLARSSSEIWSLSSCNWTWTQNHLVHKQTLNHLAKLGSSLVAVTYVHCWKSERCTTWAERAMCFSTNRFEESSDHLTKIVWWRIFDFSCFKTSIVWRECSLQTTNSPSFCL